MQYELVLSRLLLLILECYTASIQTSTVQPQVINCEKLLGAHEHCVQTSEILEVVHSYALTTLERSLLQINHCLQASSATLCTLNGALVVQLRAAKLARLAAHREVITYSLYSRKRRLRTLVPLLTSYCSNC
eukprot:3188-Heterococcus_DN1.PRE.2